MSRWLSRSLSRSVVTGDLPLLSQLLTGKGFPQFYARDAPYVLNSACLAGHLDVIDLVMAKLDFVDCQHVYPIHVAAEKADEEVIRLLLTKYNKKFDVNCFDAEGETPLCKAAERGSVKTVKLLIKCGADVNLYSGTGYTPICAASAAGHADIVRALIEAHANVAVEWAGDPGVTALLLASQDSHLEVVKLLLATGQVDVNQVRSASGATSLYMAAQSGDYEVTQALLTSKNINTNVARVTDGATPLIVATVQGFTRIAESLLQSGANPNIRMLGGFTALHAACFRGLCALVELFVTKGNADVDMPLPDTGITPLMIACRVGNLQIVEYFIKVGAKLNLVSYEGKTALGITQSSKEVLLNCTRL